MAAAVDPSQPRPQNNSAVVEAEVGHYWNWIPSIDDFWDAVERVKINFSHGYLIGFERTCIDLWHWIRSWPIWDHLPWDRIKELERKVVHIFYAIVHKLIEIGEIGLDCAKVNYRRIYHWCPRFVQKRLDWIEHHIHWVHDRIHLPSSEECWAAAERVKNNFFLGGFKLGCEVTFTDAWHLMKATTLWNDLPWDQIQELEDKVMPVYLAVAHKSIEIGQQSLELSAIAYEKVHYWSPMYVQRKLEVTHDYVLILFQTLKYFVRLHVDPDQLMHILRLEKVKSNGNGVANGHAQNVDEVDEEEDETASQMSTDELEEDTSRGTRE